MQIVRQNRTPAQSILWLLQDILQRSLQIILMTSVN